MYYITLTDKQRKAIFAGKNSNSSGKSKHGCCKPNTQFTYPDISKYEYDISRIKISEQIKYLPTKKSHQNRNWISISDAGKIDSHVINLFGKATLSFLATSILGVPISTNIEDAAFHSIEDSYRAYKKTNEIDDAVFVGIESFVNTYAKNYTFDYLQKNMQKTDNDIFDDVSKGMILISTTIISGCMVD